jgi:hypothetical protein
MKETHTQFLRMKPIFEEDPPPREIGCPNYRECLKVAAYKNYCLDCSQCPETAASDPLPSEAAPVRPSQELENFSHFSFCA